MTIKLISSLPNVITREEAAQPHKESLLPSNTSEILDIVRHEQPNVDCIINSSASELNFEKGTLLVSESKLYFYSHKTQTGLAIDYPTIIIHAISRNTALDGTGPCIYIQLGENLESALLRGSNDAPDVSFRTGEREVDTDENEDQITEIKFVPDDIGALDAIFEALSECAALHPDKEFMEEQGDQDGEYEEYENEEHHPDDDTDDQWFTNASSGEQELSEVGKASLAYLDSIIERPTSKEGGNSIDEEMFQDAEEEG
ncbi:hypothetical protein G9A89_006183 [Geosiphon pyriformis]|nr:hypothetical protein G9A89_006183 [Geosiphon pyriformis]